MEEVLHEINLKKLRKAGDNALGEVYEVCSSSAFAKAIVTRS